MGSLVTPLEWHFDTGLKIFILFLEWHFDTGLKNFMAFWYSGVFFIPLEWHFDTRLFFHTLGMAFWYWEKNLSYSSWNGILMQIVDFFCGGFVIFMLAGWDLGRAMIFCQHFVMERWMIHCQRKNRRNQKVGQIEIEEAVHLRKSTPHPSDFEIEELVCWSLSQSSRILRESGNIPIVGSAKSSQNERV